jgi:hypothetical protein
MVTFLTTFGLTYASFKEELYLCNEVVQQNEHGPQNEIVYCQARFRQKHHDLRLIVRFLWRVARVKSRLICRLSVSSILGEYVYLWRKQHTYVLSGSFDMQGNR